MPTPETSPQKKRTAPPVPRGSFDGPPTEDAISPEEFRRTVLGWGIEDAWSRIAELSNLVQVDGMVAELSSVNSPNRAAVVKLLQEVGMDTSQVNYALNYYGIRGLPLPEAGTPAPLQRRRLPPRKAAPPSQRGDQPPRGK